ncbi:MAG: hypothetical protein J4473_05145 [Candidatus Aenigmarchaeota archaeon]|nr:hypothetical protein [Candidatus Aenigmarchaeota archaeon]
MMKMERKYTIFLLIISIVLYSNVVYAGDEIKNYLTNIIYEDCKGKEIFSTPLIINKYNNQPIGSIKPPYLREDVYFLIELIIDNEPYNIKANLFSEQGGKEGNNLLVCGNKELDANFNTYEWGGQRIDPFVYNFNQTINQVIAQIGTYKSQVSQCIGNQCISENKQYNLFSDNNFYLTIGFSIGLTLMSVTIFEIIKNRIKNRRKKNDKL